MKYIATISYGKDSTVMCDLILKNKMPLDYIIFNDTMMEFEMMYEYKKKVDEYFKLRYGVEVITTIPNKTFEESVFGIIKDKNADKFGWIRGLPNPIGGFCEWRRDSKLVPTDKIIKKIIGESEYTTYVGFTASEKNRKFENGNYIYPLIDLGMTEDNCKKYLQDQEMENQLYRFFSRTGCYMCQAQSERAWYEVFTNFKKDWEYMKFVEHRFNFYKSRGYKIINEYWFEGNRTTNDMEKIFNRTADSLFDFSDEPLKDCFCKI